MDLANVGIPHNIFREIMNKPSDLNDVFYDALNPRPYMRGHSVMLMPPATQNGGMAQGGFDLQEITPGRQSAGFRMAPQGRATFVSAPNGVSCGSPGETLYGNGGHSTATSGNFTQGPDTSQNFTGSEMQTGSEFDELPGSDTTFY